MSSQGFELAAPQGFEPRYADPESAVLPLNEGAATCHGARFYEPVSILWAALIPVNGADFQSNSLNPSIHLIGIPMREDYEFNGYQSRVQ